MKIMATSSQIDLITSKDVLKITGISRATLNNYIKIGILPKPVIQKPKTGFNTTKKIGYFPRAVVGHIEMVRHLKREGNSMADIARRFQKPPVQKLPIAGTKNDGPKKETRTKKRKRTGKSRSPQFSDKEFSLTFDDVSFPAYFINYNFEIEWMNPEAGEKIFKQAIDFVSTLESKNIFKVLFNWEFHSMVKNWRDLISYHMSFTKTKFSKTWIAKLYEGISKREISVLEEIYEKVSVFSRNSIKDTRIELILKDGTVESYHVYSLFSKEGIFFIYVPGVASNHQH